MRTAPPRWAERLLALALREEDRDAALGDLAEELATRAATDGPAAARRWYRGQALRSLAPALRSRMRTIHHDGRDGMTTGTLLEARLQDARYAVRTLRRSPGFAAAALLTLGLAIGAATAVFAVVEGVLLKPLPYPEPHRLFVALQQGPEGSAWFSSPNYLDVAEAFDGRMAFAAYTPSGANVVVEGEPARVDGAEVTTGFFETLGVRPALGRTFTEEERLAGAPVAVVSDALWRDRMGAAPDAVGRTLVLDGIAREVIGVLPPVRMLPAGSDVWTPIDLAAPDWRTRRGIDWIQVVARAAPGADLAAVRSEAAALSAALRDLDPDANDGFELAFQPLEESIVGDVRTELSVLMAAVLLVLLVACVNVGGLLVARAGARREEVAVRAALGGGRRRLAAQFLTESAVLAVLGGLLGVALARAGVAGLLAMAPPGTPRLEDVGLGGPALAFALGAAALAAFAFGSLPALQAVRAPAGGLRTRGGGRPAQRLRQGLVVTQVALALALLAGAGLLGRSFWELRRVNLGFEPDGVLVAGLPVVDGDFASGEERLAHFRALEEAADALPGVREAALTNTPPFVSFGVVFSYELRGQSEEESRRQLSRFRVVGPDAFEVLGIPLLQGRTFSQDEVSGTAPPAVVVDATFAERHFPGGDAVGREVRVAGEWGRIVGVVGDIRDGSMSQASPFPHVYTPAQPATRQDLALVIRAEEGVDPTSLLEPLRREVRARAPTQPLTPARSLASFVDASVARPRFTAALLLFFAAATLLLAAVGLYGLLAYMVALRTREIGVRMALGAAAGHVRTMVVRQGMVLVGLGLALGLGLAWAGAPFLESLLFEVEARDPAVLAGVAGLLLAVSAASAWLPARRATRVAPAKALRSD